MSNCNNNYLFVLSFIAGSESGIALITAPDERSAKDMLRHGGRYNYDPSEYSIEQCRNIGMSACIRNEILIESYVNALVAYDAILAALADVKGDKGDKGDTGDPGTPAGFGYVTATIDDGTGTPSVDVIVSGPNNAKNITFLFHNLKGTGGGGSGPSTAVLYTRQTLSNPEKVQARENIGAAGISDINTLSNQINEKYTKPVAGIPASDIAENVIPDVSSFITKSVNDLTNYYLKSETYTKSEVQALIGAIQGFHYEIYSNRSYVLHPESNVLYLIGPSGSGADKYEEYVYTSDWVKIGDTSLNLSGYVTVQMLNEALVSYVTFDNLTSLLLQKQDVLVSGTNIKTINGQSILGSGNITIQGGGGSANAYIDQHTLVFTSGATVENHTLII